MFDGLVVARKYVVSSEVRRLSNEGLDRLIALNSLDVGATPTMLSLEREDA